MRKSGLIVIACIVLPCFVGAQHAVKGKVVDKRTREPIEYAFVSDRENNRNSITDGQGNFELTVMSIRDSLFVSFVGYSRKMVAIPVAHPFLIEMERSPMDLKMITIHPVSVRGSFHTLSQIDLDMRPLNSAQDLMRLVPGLFLGQHQGGGIAEHIFFRGFDADHGTDVAVSVDGMPLNLVSHAHGQGFSDLHFLIPELVSGYEFGKGPYYTEQGDFATAGYVAFRTRDELERNEIKLEGGQFHTGRVMAMMNLLKSKVGEKKQNLYVAGEASYTDGAFDWPQHFNRLNLFGKYNADISSKTKLTATLSTFSSGWRSSGEIPERAVAEGLIGRFGYIDSAQGGYTSRSNAIVGLHTSISDRLLLENQVYYSRYFFNLHYDETFFADDSVNGDQLRQRESRDLFGYNGKLTQHVYFRNGADLSSGLGVGWQLNKIYNSELSHTAHEDSVLEYIQLGNVTESSVNFFIDESYRVGKWLLNGGLRFDELHFSYIDRINPLQPARGKSILSPKFNIIYSANEKMQVYLKTGKGFHSNDAKVTTSRQGLEVLPAAYGTDLGINWKPFPRLFVNAAAWYLYLQQEFVYDADEGTIDPGGKTSRAGMDLSARYQFTSWLFAEFDINYCRARSLQAPKGDNYLPLAVPLSGTGGLYLKFRNGFSGAVSYRYMKDRPANEDNTLVAQGYFVTDLTANYTMRKFELGLEIQNLFNTAWREAQFEVESRLRNESHAVDDISFTPGTPFFAKLKFTVFF